MTQTCQNLPTRQGSELTATTHVPTPSGIHETHCCAIFKSELQFDESWRPFSIRVDSDILCRLYSLNGKVSSHAKVKQNIRTFSIKLIPEILAFTQNRLHSPIQQGCVDLLGSTALEDLCMYTMVPVNSLVLTTTQYARFPSCMASDFRVRWSGLTVDLLS
jgi:hypothetical protein